MPKPYNAAHSFGELCRIILSSKVVRYIVHALQFHGLFLSTTLVVVLMLTRYRVIAGPH